MQPNQQYDPFQNVGPNPLQTPPPEGYPSQIPVQSGYQQPQSNIPPAQPAYDPWQIQAPQPGHFHQPGATPDQPPQQWNPKTSMFEPVQPVRPSEWEQQFVAETVAAAAAPAAPKKFHAGRVVAIIVGILLLVGGAAAAYVYAQQKSTNQEPVVAAKPVDTKALFYDAIENHMSVSYIGQQFDIEQVEPTLGRMVANAKGLTDFSNPAKPKSRITYDIKGFDTKPPLNVTGELLDLQENNYYAQLTKPDATATNNNPAGADIEMDTWYQVPVGDNAYGMFLFDVGSMRTTINVSEGQMLVGNYPENIRKDLMKYIKDNKVYTIKNTEAVNSDDTKMTKYTVSIDGSALNKLNDKARAALAIKTSDPRDYSKDGGDDINYELFVDTNEKRLAKVHIERPSSDKKFTDKVTVTFSYPKDLAKELRKPVLIKSLPAPSSIN